MIEQATITLLGVATTFTFGAVGVMWSIYNKASTTQKDDYAKLNEKIDNNTAHCVNKQRDLQMNIDQNRDMILQVRAELSQAFMEHKVDTINRQDANLLMEEKIKPIRESVEEIKAVQRDATTAISKVLQSLARIEGSMGIAGKRSEDY